MPKGIRNPNAVIDTSQNWDYITALEVTPTSGIKNDGLVNYWGPFNAVQDPTNSNKVSSCPPWVGYQTIINNYSSQAPTIETHTNGEKLLRMTYANVSTLVSGTTRPSGNSIIGDFTKGFTLTFAYKNLTATQSQGICGFNGFLVKSFYATSSTNLQVQRISASGTSSAQLVTDLTSMCILSIQFDKITNTLKFFKNGVRILTSTGQYWSEYTGLSNSVFVLGANYNATTSASAINSDAQFGDICIHNFALTELDVSIMHTYLKSKYNIV